MVRERPQAPVRRLGTGFSSPCRLIVGYFLNFPARQIPTMLVIETFRT